MNPFKRITALALGAMLASGLLLFGACSPEPIEPEVPEEPEDTSVYAFAAQTTSCFLLLDDENYASAQPSFLAKKDKVTDENPEITFAIADPAIAEVSADGVVTPKAYGKTELIATYHTKTARVPVNVFERTSAENVNSFDEQYVNRYGRQYFTDNKLNVDHVSSGIEVAFLGESLTANVATVGDVFVHIYIDGDSVGEFVRMTAGAFPLAEGLGEGIHTVRMLKASEIDCGKFTVSGFEADEFLRIPEKSDLKVEFIGDSITAGYGTLAVPDQDGKMPGRTVENSDACTSYAALTGQKLGADFSVVALSGICLKMDIWGAHINMTQMHSYLSNLKRDPYTYDTDMDVVVLALGTNDGSYIDSYASYARLFPTDYAEFLTHLRAIYPDAYIVCIYGMMGMNSSVNKGIEQALREVGDAKMSYKTFAKNTFGPNSHPNGQAHVAYANQLTEYILELIG